MQPQAPNIPDRTVKPEYRELNIFDMSEDELREVYPRIREDMRSFYTRKTSPRRLRSRQRQADKMRAGGSPLGERRDAYHKRRADRLEQRIEEDVERYENTSLIKFLIAILLGSYDSAITDGRYAGHYSDEDANALIQRASVLRAQRLNVSSDLK